MKTVRRAVKASCVFAAAWCLLGFAAPAARAQVLNQVPSDALVVVKINKLSETNAKIGSFLQTLGITDMVPTLKDPLASLESQSGMGAGIDTKRDAAAVIVNGKFDENAPPPFILLLPVSDYKAFLGSVTVVRTEGDVTVAHFKDEEDDAFIENWGDYAAISDKKENVLMKHEGLKLKGAASKQMDEKDFCVYVNFPAIKPLLLPQLKEAPDKAMEALGREQNDPGKLKLAKVAVNQLVAAATEFLNDAESATIGVSVTNDGISSSMVVELAPDSYLGKMASEFKSTEGPLLTGLPKEDYLVFGGYTQNPKAVSKVFDDLIAPITKELAGMGDDGKKTSEALTAYRDSMASVDSASGGLIAPTAAFGQGPMIRFVGSVKGDAEKLKAANLKIYDGQNQIMAMLGAPGGDLLKTTVTPNFKTIHDIKFDRIQTEVDPNNTSQEAMHASDALGKTFGPDGDRVLLGTIDPKSIVFASGVDDELIGDAVDAVKENKDLLTEQLKLVDAGLPKNRSAVAYIGLGQIVGTAFTYAKAQGFPMQVQIPANLPPIGITFGTEGPTMQYASFVPTKLLQSLVQAGMNIAGKFGGGGGGGL
jgi:hypothetical protein